MNDLVASTDQLSAAVVQTPVTEPSALPPIFSIVILTRNRGHFLPRTLRAVLNHEGPSREILLFDNGSTDNTAAVASEFPLRYFFTPELGLGEMRQRGLEEAGGEFVVMCDDDCLPRAGWLGEFLHRFRADDSLALIGGKIINIGFEGINKVKGIGAFGVNSQIISNVPIEQATYFGCANLALRRRAALQAGGFDPFLVCGYEEGDIAHSLQSLGHRIVYASEAAVDHHNVDATQRSRWRWNHNGLMRIYFHLKHFRPAGLNWVRFLAAESRIQLHSLVNGGRTPLHHRLFAGLATFCVLPRVIIRSGQARAALLTKNACFRGREPDEVPPDDTPHAKTLSATPKSVAKRTFEFAVCLPVFLFLAVHLAGLLSFRTASESLALIPGKLGVIWRRLWYRHTLRTCGDKLVVEWMSVFKSPTASVGDRVYVGPFCWISRAQLGHDVMLAGRVTILSGKAQHGTERLDVPMRQQAGIMVDVQIGRDVWVGDGAVITADVADGTVVGAGSIVTRRFEDYSIIAGNPAKFMRLRGQLQEAVA